MIRSKVIKLLALVLVVPAGVVVWYLASPLWVNNVVVEEAPPGIAQTTSGVGAAGDMVKRGSLRDAGDGFHKGSGAVKLVKAGESHLLRLEEINVTNGPDLYVILSPHADPMSSQEALTAGYINLGKLKGNIGSQNYEVPGNVDLEPIKSAVIYCLSFHTVFSVAPLR